MNQYRYLNSKELGKAVRTEVKKLGFSNKEISVIMDNYSMGRTIHVTAKIEGIDYTKLKKDLSQFEDVSRDEYGDILSGGNTFLHISKFYKR